VQDPDTSSKPLELTTSRCCHCRRAGFDNIVNLRCDAGNKFADQLWKIMSIAQRQWTVNGQAA
jgi:hypothetical protein